MKIEKTNEKSREREHCAYLFEVSLSMYTKYSFSFLYEITSIFNEDHSPTKAFNEVYIWIGTVFKNCKTFSMIVYVIDYLGMAKFLSILNMFSRKEYRTCYTA